MKFIPIVSKNANFYFFVQNLSEWHFSARKSYNNFWESELGKLSKEEKSALDIFKEIRLKYSPTKSIFEQAFFLEKNPWVYLNKNLTKENLKRLQKVFDVLREKFNVLYKKEEELLKSWETALNNQINQRKNIEWIISILTKLYNTEKPTGETFIFLLFSALTHTGGGANINDKSISVEVSRYPSEKINHIIGIIWHEVVHLYFDKKYFHPLLRRLLVREEKKWFLINELTASALFPKGILGVKLLNLKPQQTLHNKLAPEYSDRIIKLMETYIEQRKTLDEAYIKEVSTLVSNK